MDASYLELSYFQVGLATALIIANGVVSVALRLGLEWRLLMAGTRTVVQLLLIGFVLDWIFALRQPAIVLLLGFTMAVVAGVAATSRTERYYSLMWLDAIVCVWASSWLITAVALGAIIQVRPWYLPQYAIPLVGMILGNTLNGISLGLDRLGTELTRGRDEVETMLALGATRWEAARPCVQRAVQTGMVPIVNAMMVVGIVNLPGMMTGQLLAGVEPLQAVKYQIVIMFLIAAGTALGTLSVVLLAYRRLFSNDHQLLTGLLRTRQSSQLSATRRK